MIIDILFIGLGLALLIIGAEFLIKGSSNIAKKFHIPEILIGLTIVSIGTSMPELIITIESALQGSSDLIVGNSVGSDLCNLLLILGIMALIRPIEIQDETRRFHIPISFISSVIIWIIGAKIGIIDLKIGIVLIVLFLAYLSYPILLDRKKIIEEYKNEKLANTNGKKNNKVNNKANNEENINKKNNIEENYSNQIYNINNYVNENNRNNSYSRDNNILVQICYMILGIVLLKFGGDFVVDNATDIARSYGISERIIGLTIVAIGTALPELVTSIVAIISDDTDIGVGNLIGSSVFNTLLIFGVGAVINPIEISVEFFTNLILLMASNIVIWIFCYIPEKNIITRFKGFVLVTLFVASTLRLFI